MKRNLAKTEAVGVAVTEALMAVVAAATVVEVATAAVAVGVGTKAKGDTKGEEIDTKPTRRGFP
jgi:hypothetical protein